MKILKFLPVLLVVPSVVYGATRGDSSARIGVTRGAQAGARMSGSAADIQKAKDETLTNADTSETTPAASATPAKAIPGDCRDAYRE